MNYFCVMGDRRKAFSLISSRDHCQRPSPSRISDTLRAGFEFPQNLSSGLAEWSCAVVITTTPRRHKRCPLQYVKSVRIRSYSCPYFPAFRLNTERYSVSLRIQSECGNMRNRITPNTDTFYAVLGCLSSF